MVGIAREREITVWPKRREHNPNGRGEITPSGKHALEITLFDFVRIDDTVTESQRQYLY